MTTSCRWSTFRSAVAALIVLGGVAAGARPARAQACCASAGLVAPTRLRAYEDFAAGIVGHGRSVLGAFAANGAHADNAAGDSEWDFEQDLFGVARVGLRAQIAAVIPFDETTRQTGAGGGDAGGGIGDVALSGRIDFILTGERRIIPGIALLLGLVAPTGTPPESARTPAGATGQGSWQGSVGVAIEQAYEPYFVTVNALVGWRTARPAPGGDESFGTRLTGIVAAGRVLPRGATAGVFVSVVGQGDNSDATGRIAGSDLLLLTAGLAGTLSLSDEWRLQGTVTDDLPFRGLGRNQPTGVGASVSIMRLWL